MSREAILNELSLIAAENEQHGVPPNESNTCEQVIVPLLLSMGYGRREILSRSFDAGGQFPDYTILPDSEHTWFLEAKAWNERLTTNAVDQAINYAHRCGRRWVVLTNGREWQLFDDYIQASNAERRVLTASFNDNDGLVDFLAMLSKQSIVAGEIEKTVSASRMRSVLEVELANPDGEIVNSIAKILQRRPGLGAVRSVDVSAYFSKRRSMEAPIAPRAPRTFAEPKEAVVPSTHGNYDSARIDSEVGLDGDYTNRKPLKVSWNGQSKSVQTWRDVAATVMVWAKDAGQFPDLPFRAGQRTGNFIANTDRGMTQPFAVADFWMEGKLSAKDILRCTRAACEAAGFDWSEVRIKLAKVP